MTKEELEKCVVDYNNSQPEGSKRLILQEHDFYCRCTDCWYKYNGAERRVKHGDGNWRSLQESFHEEAKG